MRFSYEVPGFRAACTVRVVRSGILDAASHEELADAPVRVDGDSLVWQLEVAPRQLFGAVVRVELELNDAVLEPMHEDFGEQQEASEGALTRWLDAAPEFESDSATLKAVYDKSIVDLAALRIEGDAGQRALRAAGRRAAVVHDALRTGHPDHVAADPLGGSGSRARRSPPARGAAGQRDRRVPRRGAGEDPARDSPGRADGPRREASQPVLRNVGCHAAVAHLAVGVLAPHRRRRVRSRPLASASWPHSNGSTASATATRMGTSSTQRARPRVWAISAGRTPGTGFSSRTAAFRSSRLPRRRSRDTSTTRSCASQSSPGGAWTTLRLPTGSSARPESSSPGSTATSGRTSAVATTSSVSTGTSRPSTPSHRTWATYCGRGSCPRSARAPLQATSSPRICSAVGVCARSRRRDLGYNPIGYHTGTIWPHDNAIIALGLARYGFRDEANRIALAQIEAATPLELPSPRGVRGLRPGDQRIPGSLPDRLQPASMGDWRTFCLRQGHARPRGARPGNPPRPTRARRDRTDPDPQHACLRRALGRRSERDTRLRATRSLNTSRVTSDAVACATERNVLGEGAR